jgi:Dihydroxyacetone kinase
MDVKQIVIFLDEIKRIMCEQREYLIQLDSVVGDGDLGLTMSDGFTAAYHAVEETKETDIGKVFYQAGKAMSIAVPSTMGTLMASGLMQIGKGLKGKENLENPDILQLFRSFEEGVMKLGKAKIGDKTFLDGLHPAIEVIEAGIEQGEVLQVIAKKAKMAAQEGFKNTTNMIAVHGRAAIRGEESRQLEDPGAAVAMFVMEAFASTIY